MLDQPQNPDGASGPDPDDFDGIPDLDAYLALMEIGDCLTRLASVGPDRLDPMRRRICVAAGALFDACDEAGVPLTSPTPSGVRYPLLTHLIVQTAPAEVLAIARRRAAGAPGGDFHTLASWLVSVVPEDEQ